MTKYLLSLLLIAFTSDGLIAQSVDSSDAKVRFFMPALQMGYINHNSPTISEGFVIQTSLEYRAADHWLFRINYDDFSGRMQVSDLNGNRFSARVPLSELIAGLGYRYTWGRHNAFAVVQSGIRFYELPTIQEVNGLISIVQSAEQINPVRYTLGYEYEFMDKVFLNIEFFSGHFWSEKDYWSNAQGFYGLTAGLSTTIY